MPSSLSLEVTNLSKTFRVRENSKSLLGSFSHLFRPTYQNVEAVKNISFQLKQGDRVAFIGPNGAGKSTTIKMLSGILYPSAGTIAVLGMDPSKERVKVVKHLGAVFGQRSQLWYHLPAGDTFDLLAKIYEIDPSHYRERRQALTEAFDLGPLLTKPVRQLSLGERMRCEIVASLLHKPQVLFLDEPTIGLDADAKARIRDLVRRAALEEGTTVLLTSHDTGDIEEVCDRVIVIDHGTIILDEPMSDLRNRYLTKKRITIYTSGEAPNLQLPGTTWVEVAPHRLILEVDTSKTPAGKAVSMLLQMIECSDVSVEDPPMEEIVRYIYAEERRRR